MVEIGGVVGDLTSGIDLSGLPLIITIGAIILILMILAGIVTWFIVQKKRYYIKVVIYENIAGRGYMKTGLDSACLVKQGDNGMLILRLRKRKVYRGIYGRKTGTNEYTFAIGPDGLWYNIVFGDLEDGMKKIGMVPVDKNILAQQNSIRKTMKAEFDKQSFLQRFGGILAIGILIVMLGISIWLGTWNQVKSAELINQGLENSQKLRDADAANMKAQQEIVASAAKILEQSNNLLNRFEIVNSGSLDSAT